MICKRTLRSKRANGRQESLRHLGVDRLRRAEADSDFCSGFSRTAWAFRNVLGKDQS